MLIKEIESDKSFKKIHTSWARGYISRKIGGVVEIYSGKFGNGFKIHYPTYKSTQYHRVTYFVI